MYKSEITLLEPISALFTISGHEHSKNYTSFIGLYVLKRLKVASMNTTTTASFFKCTDIYTIYLASYTTAMTMTNRFNVKTNEFVASFSRLCFFNIYLFLRFHVCKVFCPAIICQTKLHVKRGPRLLKVSTSEYCLIFYLAKAS